MLTEQPHSSRAGTAHQNSLPDRNTSGRARLPPSRTANKRPPANKPRTANKACTANGRPRAAKADGLSRSFTLPVMAEICRHTTACIWHAGGLCLVLLALSGCSTAPDLDTSRRFQEAEQLFAEASTPQQFVRVASLYQEILDDGFSSGVVYYNQGNAWMQAGQTGRAVAAYRQAKRRMPRDAYVQANLQTALRTAGTTVPEQSLLDHLFFWQSSISYREKMLLTTILLSAVVLLAVLSHLRQGPSVPRKLMIALLPVCILMLLSTARDWISIEQTVHVVVVENVVARKGGSTTYEPAFTQPLRDGAEVILLGTQNDWLRIQVPGTGEAWIPRRAAVTY